MAYSLADVLDDPRKKIDYAKEKIESLTRLKRISISIHSAISTSKHHKELTNRVAKNAEEFLLNRKDLAVSIEVRNKRVIEVNVTQILGKDETGKTLTDYHGLIYNVTHKEKMNVVKIVWDKMTWFQQYEYVLAEKLDDIDDHISAIEKELDFYYILHDLEYQLKEISSTVKELGKKLHGEENRNFLAYERFTYPTRNLFPYLFK